MSLGNGKNSSSDRRSEASTHRLFDGTSLLLTFYHDTMNVGNHAFGIRNIQTSVNGHYVGIYSEFGLETGVRRVTEAVTELT